VFTLLALAVVWAALVAPIRPWLLTPGSFVRLPLERLVLVGLAVVLPSPARAVVPWLVGPGLGGLVFIKRLDLAFLTAIDRPFNPVEDPSSLSLGVGTVRATFGSRGAALPVAAALAVALARLAIPALAVGQLTHFAARRRGRSLQAVTA